MSNRLTSFLILSSLSACAAPALDGARRVDLTHAYDDRTVFWPTGEGFDLEVLARGPTDAGYFYSANRFCMAEHCGTHMDAPIHFAENGDPVDEVPLERLIAPAVVIDLAAAAEADPDYRATREDILAHERMYGEIRPGDCVLFRFGWSARWPDTRAYLGDDTPGDASNLHFPGIAEDAARLLVERGVAMVGLDTASLDHGPSRDFIAHQVLNGANVPGLENLANLDLLPPTGAWIVALPMKIRGGSGGPCRVVALVP